MDESQDKPKKRSTKKSHFKRNNTKSATDFKARTRLLHSSQENNDWNLYFPENISEGDLSLISKLEAAESFLSNYNEETLIAIYNSRSFTLNVCDIIKHKSMKSSWSDFLKDLEYTPNLVISIFGFIANYIIKQNKIPGLVKNAEKKEEDIPSKVIIPHFTGLRNLLRFQDLKSYNYGRFITVIGIVIRASDVKPICTEMAFSCLKCQEIQISIQEKSCYTTPNRCKASSCYSTAFKPLLRSKHTQTVPWKNVRLQELNVDQSEGGRVPRSIECELTRDLTNLCIPGDVVVISGIVDVNNSNEKKMTASKDACTYTLYINANSVTSIKGKNIDGIEVNADTLDIIPEDLDVIKQIHSEPNLFRLVVASLSPHIYGHELVKAGLILALFGGGTVSKEDTKDTRCSTRENSHVLIVGDPGLGKSQMLLASANVSPRSVYVCGNSTTASGLTVTVTKEGGESSLEAGALVLADQGHCCIDEFDKMMQQHSALLEAMEQQTISLAKSGVVCTLPARTSIIAAANPSGGHYSRGKTVSENLKIKGALLSRFDLVFILQDRADMVFDVKMSEHVMGLHTEKPSCSRDTNYYFDKSFSLNNSLNNCERLLKRLQVKFNEKLTLLSQEMLRKYITYVRKFSQPSLNIEVCDILKNFYLEMRRQHNLNKSTPITTRQLESLIRLTRARARVELRPYCTTGDAEDVIEIMKYSMRDTFSDEFGNIDIDRSIHGSGMSKCSQAKKLINALTRAAGVKGDDCFTVSEMKDIAQNIKIPIDTFHSLLETLNNQGFLLKKGFQLYKVETI